MGFAIFFIFTQILIWATISLTELAGLTEKHNEDSEISMGFVREKRDVET